MTRRFRFLLMGLAVVLLRMPAFPSDPTPFVGGLPRVPRNKKARTLPRGQGPVETFSSAVAGHLGSKFSEELWRRLEDFHAFFSSSNSSTDAANRRIKYKLRFHPDPSHDGERMKTVYWNPFKASLAVVFTKLEWDITSFEMRWINDEGEVVVLSNEDDVEYLLEESSNKTLVVDVQLKQPSAMEKIKEKTQQLADALVQKAKHCICGGGQIEQKHVTQAEEALTGTDPRVTNMEATKTALSQENFDIEAFPEPVPNIAAKLGMSENESSLLALAQFVDRQASADMKTYYDNQGRLVKRVTSWRTIRTNSARGKPDKIHLVYGDFVFKCKVPEGGLEMQRTMILEKYVDLRAKLEWRQQLEEDAQHVPVLLFSKQAPCLDGSLDSIHTQAEVLEPNQTLDASEPDVQEAGE